MHATWKEAARRVESAAHEIPVPYRADVFPFFTIAGDERRRIGALPEAAREVEAGRALPSADVLTRPALKSWLLPMAASILGPSEIAYHSESLALFPLWGLKAPVLLPRTHAVLTGPADRRAAEALGLTIEQVLTGDARPPTPALPVEAEQLEAAAQTTDRALAALQPALKALDASLGGSLETARRKVSYQIEQLVERIRKAAERKEDVASGRHKRLETMLLPGGGGADRVYPPLVPMLAHGRSVLAAIRAGSTGSLEGAAVIAIGAETAEAAHAG